MTEILFRIYPNRLDNLTYLIYPVGNWIDLAEGWQVSK